MSACDLHRGPAKPTWSKWHSQVFAQSIPLHAYPYSPDASNSKPTTNQMLYDHTQDAPPLKTFPLPATRKNSTSPPLRNMFSEWCLFGYLRTTNLHRSLCNFWRGKCARNQSANPQPWNPKSAQKPAARLGVAGADEVSLPDTA